MMTIRGEDDNWVAMAWNDDVSMHGTDMRPPKLRLLAESRWRL